MTSLGEKLLRLNWKCSFSPFTYPITYKVGFWYFESLCNRDTVSNKTYQYFQDKRLVRPGSKCPNWQGPQPISYNVSFSHRDSIYLVDLKSNITYQNIWGKLRSDRFLYHEMLKTAKKLPYNLHGWALYKFAKFVLTKKSYQKLTTFSITKAWSDPKVNPQMDNDLNP